MSLAISVLVTTRLKGGPNDGDVITNEVPLPLNLWYTGDAGPYEHLLWTPDIEYPKGYGLHSWNPFVWHLYRYTGEFAESTGWYVYRGWME